MSLAPNDRQSCGTRAAVVHHAAHAEECPACEKSCPALADARAENTELRNLIAAVEAGISAHPAYRFGRHHIRGVSTEAIADMVWAGETLTRVQGDYVLSRAEVLLACWHEARHGTQRSRRRWRSWLAQVDPLLWKAAPDWDAIPDPPSAQEITKESA